MQGQADIFEYMDTLAIARMIDQILEGAEIPQQD